MAEKEEQRRLLHERGICVIIPTYNNGATIADVVSAALRECGDVIVVNDGCTDGTADTLKGIQGITTVEYGGNRGKGYALKRGFRKAIEMGFAYAITIDADGQHYPSDINKFLKANQEHPGALILGKRQLEGVDRSKGSSFANKFSNFWFSVQTLQRIDDTQTGYRLYPLKKLCGLSLLTSRYEAELELIVFASWHGVKLISIPVNVYYPPREERVSHFRPTADFARISILNTVLCLLAIIYALPLRIWRGLMTLLRTVYSLLFFLFFSVVVFTPLIWLYLKIGKMTEKKRLALHKLIWRASRFIMLKHGIPGIRFRYRLEEEPDFSTPHVIICNHQSHLDLMCQLIFTPKIVFLTNKWVWNNPCYGLMIRNAEYLPVTEGIENLMPQLRSLAERGYSIAVFPEGTRSRDCEIGRFHQGAFYIAEQLNLPVLPMMLYGAGKVLPKKTYHLRRGLIYIEVEKAISQAGMKAMGDIKAQTKRMHRYYKEKYEHLKNKLEQNV